MQKGAILIKGHRYLKSKVDGYVLPWTKALSQNKQWEEFVPFPVEPPEEKVVLKTEEAELRKKFEELSKREIAKMAGLEMNDNDIRYTRKPKVVEKAIEKMMWR